MLENLSSSTFAMMREHEQSSVKLYQTIVDELVANGNPQRGTRCSVACSPARMAYIISLVGQCRGIAQYRTQRISPAADAEIRQFMEKVMAEVEHTSPAFTRSSWLRCGPAMRPKSRPCIPNPTGTRIVGACAQMRSRSQSSAKRRTKRLTGMPAVCHCVRRPSRPCASSYMHADPPPAGGFFICFLPIHALHRRIWPNLWHFDPMGAARIASPRSIWRIESCRPMVCETSLRAVFVSIPPQRHGAGQN